MSNNRGGQLGNQNAAKGKRWEAAILRAVEAWPKEPDSTDCSALIIGLNKAAHEFVKGVYERGDLGFFKEFGDRLEGKPSQPTELSGNVNVGLAHVLSGLGKTDNS